MPTVLVVHHTVSPATAAVYEAVRAGLDQPGLEEVSMAHRPALAAGPADVFAADGIVLLTPVNIGYLSGALKHFFDSVYYPCLEETKQLPFAAVLHGTGGAQGAVRALTAITTGLQWQQVAEPLIVDGSPDAATTEQIGELAATVAAHAAGLL